MFAPTEPPLCSAATKYCGAIRVTRTPLFQCPCHSQPLLALAPLGVDVLRVPVRERITALAVCATVKDDAEAAMTAVNKMRQRRRTGCITTPARRCRIGLETKDALASPAPLRHSGGADKLTPSEPFATPRTHVNLEKFDARRGRLGPALQRKRAYLHATFTKSCLPCIYKNRGCHHFFETSCGRIGRHGCFPRGINA